MPSFPQRDVGFYISFLGIHHVFHSNSHSKPQKNTKRKGQLPQNVSIKMLSPKEPWPESLSVCDRQSFSFFLVWACLTGSFNYFLLSALSMKILTKQLAASLAVHSLHFTERWAASWCERAGVLMFVSCWFERSPALALVRDWTNKADVIFAFLEYSLRFLCLYLCICVCVCCVGLCAVNWSLKHAVVHHNQRCPWL